jgi:hypothetical protein
MSLLCNFDRNPAVDFFQGCYLSFPKDLGEFNECVSDYMDVKCVSYSGPGGFEYSSSSSRVFDWGMAEAGLRDSFDVFFTLFMAFVVVKLLWMVVR